MELGRLLLILALLAVGAHCGRGRKRLFDYDKYKNDSAASELQKRGGRLFSLFNVVTFKHYECTDSFGDSGVCVSASECSSKGGTAQGKCASGFGVCCLIVQDTCSGDAQISHNCSYIQSPGYPSGYTTSGSCRYVINRVADNICSIRLDYVSFTIQPPDKTNKGSCSTDSASFTDAHAHTPPIICGENAGQHFFLDAGFHGTAEISVTIAIGSGSTEGRKWRIKVSQMPCGGPSTPPSDCGQYYTSHSAIVRSFNFLAQPGDYLHLNDQHYTVCVRQEAGHCMLKWTPTSDDYSFRVTKDGTNTIAETGSENCGEDFVIIPHGHNGDEACTTKTYNPALGNSHPVNTIDRYCGGHLSCVNQDDTYDRPIFTNSFFLRVSFNSKENTATTNNNRGFALNYVQG